MKILSLFLCFGTLLIFLNQPIIAETCDIIFTSKMTGTWKEKEFTPELTSGMSAILGDFSVTNYYKITQIKNCISLLNWSFLYEKASLLKNKTLTIKSGVGTFSYEGASSKFYSPIPAIPSAQIGNNTPSSYSFGVLQPCITLKPKEVSMFASALVSVPNVSLLKGLQATISGVYYPKFNSSGNEVFSGSMAAVENSVMAGKCDASLSVQYTRTVKFDFTARYTIFGTYTPIASNITPEKSLDSSWFQRAVYFQPYGNHYLIQEAFISVDDSSLQVIYGIAQSPFGGQRKYFTSNTLIQVGEDYRGIYRGFVWFSDEGVFIPKKDGKSTENMCPLLVYANPQLRMLFSDDLIFQFGGGLSVKSTLSGGKNNYQTANARSALTANLKIHRLNFVTTISSEYEKENTRLLITDKSTNTDKSTKYVLLNTPVLKNLVTGVFFDSQKTSVDCDLRYAFLLPMESKLISDVGFTGSREKDDNSLVTDSNNDVSYNSLSGSSDFVSDSNSVWIQAKRNYGVSAKLSLALPTISSHVKALSLSTGTSWSFNFPSGSSVFNSLKGSLLFGASGRTGKFSHSIQLSVSPINDAVKCKTEFNYIVTLICG